MNTIAEIQSALDELVRAMTDKGVKRPDASLNIQHHGRYRVWLDDNSGDKFFDGKSYAAAYGDTVAEAFMGARNCIAALPSSEERVTRQYLKHVATAIDYATENSIADEYVSPLRGVSCAMTENLLTDGRKA